MLVGQPLPFVKNYVEKLSDNMELRQAKTGLTPGRKAWLSFCFMCIIVTESICWRKFVRASLGSYSEALLSWYFRGPMTWDLLLSVSVNMVLEHFNTFEGVLVIDDTGKKRSKTTKKIPYVHYFKDKEGTGTRRGQEVVFLILVTPFVTIPVAFDFYQPDPNYTKWAKQDKRLKKLGIPKCQRPPKPAIKLEYPTKQQIALRLLEQFVSEPCNVTIKAVLADTLYGCASFMQQVTQIVGEKQVISQLQSDQKIHYRGRTWHIDEYFKAYPGVLKTIKIRGFDTQKVIVGSARLYVEAQECKRFIIAIRYENQEDYRYLVASDMSWRTLDIVQAYTLRWLVEVTIEDLKVYEGWGQATKQPGVEGSRRGLSLSLLCDHCLLLHPELKARVERQEPLCTIGSRKLSLQMESFIAWLQDWLDGDGFTEKIEQLTQTILPLFPWQPSKKHIHGNDLGRLESTPTLKHKGIEAQKNIFL